MGGSRATQRRQRRSPPGSRALWVRRKSRGQGVAAGGGREGTQGARSLEMLTKEEGAVPKHWRGYERPPVQCVYIE